MILLLGGAGEVLGSRERATQTGGSGGGTAASLGLPLMLA